MKARWKSVLTLVLFVPFFHNLAYMFGAWQYSPLDRNDFVFWLLVLAAVAVFLFRIKKIPDEKPEKAWDYCGFLMLAASAAILIFASLKDINTVYLAGGLLFIASGCWILWGWRVFWLLSPVFFIAALGLPSTSYWTSFLFRNYIRNYSGFSIKLFFAIMALLWFAATLYRPRKIFIRPEPFFFYLGLTVFIFGYAQSSGPAPRGAPICLEIKPAAAGWLGEKLPLSDLDESLQGKNLNRRYVHYSKLNACAGSLCIELRNDLHQIHPTALCLATACWKILSNDLVLLKTKYGTLSAARIIAEKDGERSLFFSWYTNNSFSTGSFISFRKSWHFNESWHIYQIMTPVTQNETAAETVLLNFINTFATVK
ncbi:MAG: hypothetical protein PHV82_11090 [Victivallaceae bacterium]|nr:hypothetical protein [Victivallaceae bacterium]